MNKNYSLFMALALLECKNFWDNFGGTNNNNTQLESTREFLSKKRRRKKR